MKRRDTWMVGLGAVMAKYDSVVDPENINCATFVGEAIEAMTGIDPMEEFGRGNINDQLKILADKGFDSPIEYVASLLPEIHPNFASVGDIAVFKGQGNLPAFGIVIGDYARVLCPDGSPGVMPVSEAEKVFKL